MVCAVPMLRIALVAYLRKSDGLNSRPANQPSSQQPCAQVARNRQPTGQLKRAANKFVALLNAAATRSHMHKQWQCAAAAAAFGDGDGSSPCSRRRAHWRECLINFKWHLNAFAAFHFSAVSHAFSWLLLLLLLLLHW